MKRGQWEEIFRAGDYGDKGKFTRADLDQMVANFNTEDQVPVVIGHPTTDSPAWGWIGEVKRDGDVLLARPEDLHGDFVKALDEKQFKNRSVRIGASDSGPKLLHLGYLGAALPQVEGLKTAQFADGGKSVDYNFKLGDDDPRTIQTQTREQDMEKDQKIKDLEKKLADEKAARKSEQEAAAKKEAAGRKSAFARFVESKMIATGKLAKDRKDEAVAFLMTLPSGESADFSWGDEDKEKGSSAAWFQEFVAGLPAADFVRDLPAGETKDFAGNKKPGAMVDLSHQV